MCPGRGLDGRLDQGAAAAKGIEERFALPDPGGCHEHGGKFRRERPRWPIRPLRFRQARAEQQRFQVSAADHPVFLAGAAGFDRQPDAAGNRPLQRDLAAPVNRGQFAVDVHHDPEPAGVARDRRKGGAPGHARRVREPNVRGLAAGVLASTDEDVVGKRDLGVGGDAGRGVEDDRAVVLVDDAEPFSDAASEARTRSWVPATNWIT